MDLIEKLYTFEVRDKFGLSSEKLSEFAREGAQQMAADLGWSISEVKFSDIPSKIEDGFTVHSFDFFGKSNAQGELDKNSNPNQGSTPYSKSAVSDVNI